MKLKGPLSEKDARELVRLRQLLNENRASRAEVLALIRLERLECRAEIEGFPVLSRPQLQRLGELLGQLEAALNGKPQKTWGGGARKPWTRLLRQAGVHLFTKTALNKIGQEPKKGAKPVVVAYFEAPISNYGELYILGVQTAPKKTKRQKGAEHGTHGADGGAAGAGEKDHGIAARVRGDE